MRELLLGVDIGTSACKVAVFNKEGEVIASGNGGYQVYYPHPGWAEQNPDEWWSAVCSAIGDVLKKGDIKPEEIKGIGVDGQSWSAIPIDKEGNVLANTPIWMDTRAQSICDRLNAGIGADNIFQVAGNSMQPSYSTAKILWYKENLNRHRYRSATASAMSCMRNDDLHTPNMDKLAQAGVLFRNAYCSTPLSGPARAAMFTGYTSHEVGLARNGTPIPDSLRTRTLGTLMQNAGYDCIYAGKWHVHTASMPDKEFGFTTIHPHSDNGLAEACVGFLEQKHTNPFFLVAGFDNPHNICEYARSQNLPWGNIEDLPQNEWPGLPLNFAKNPYDADVISYEQSLNYSAYPTRNYTPDDWRRDVGVENFVGTEFLF